MLWISTSFLFAGLADRSCNLTRLSFGENTYLFSYPEAAQGGTGLSGFLGFLLAYVCAQIVNYFVQRKLVFMAPVLTNILNILIQVAINYPMMKFVIMKKN